MTCQVGWGHPQSESTRRKIAQALHKAWVIERWCQYTGRGVIEFADGELLDCEGLSYHKKIIRIPGYPPFADYDVPPERAFLKVVNLRRFCRSEGLDYGNLYKTYSSGGWCYDMVMDQEWKIIAKYSIRAQLNSIDDSYSIPCERHTCYNDLCRSCKATGVNRVGFSDGNIRVTMYTGAKYERIFPRG